MLKDGRWYKDEAEYRRSIARTAKIPHEYARSFGTDGTTVGGTRQPKTTTTASHCVSYKLDADGNEVGAHIFSTPRTSNPVAKREAEVDRINRMNEHRTTAADLAAIQALVD